MSLENNISTIIQEQMKSDLVERVVKEQLERCVANAVNDLFGSWGDCTRVVKEKLKEVLMPQLEGYDYSEHIVKLDAVLTEILKETTLENKKILGNFKEFMCNEDIPEEIEISKIFDKYMAYVEKHVETDGLEINYDDDVSYECVEVKFEVEKRRGKSLFNSANVFFECEHDEEMNFEIRLSKYKDNEYWTISIREEFNLRSLKYLDEFTIFLMKLFQNGTRIIIDKEYDEYDITPEATPEASFS